MKSLTVGEEADNSGHQSLNLQQRVIQSGLDSLTGTDAESIVTLFKVIYFSYHVFLIICNYMCVISQGHGSVCRGPNRSGEYLVCIVGQYRSRAAQAIVFNEGATVDVAVAVTLNLAGLISNR